MREPRPANGGFTLVELIVAITLTVLIAGTTVAMLRSSVAARERVDRHAALQADARAAIETVATALRNACRLPSREEPLEGVDGLLAGSPADRIRFFTVSPRAVRRRQPESDVRECEFFLHQKDLDAPPSLMRRLDPTRNARPDGGGVIERVADNIICLDIAYFHAGQWLDEWTEEHSGWPEAVRVRIVAVTADPPRRSVALSRIVNFPHSPRSGGKESGEGESKESSETESKKGSESAREAK